jgi:endonuclease-3
MKENSNTKKILKLLKKKYPSEQTFLHHQNVLELLIATILSAQCTDARVNVVTKKLFKKYKTLDDYCNAEQKEFEQDIRSTGFYRNKTKNILAACKKIKNEFHGIVPNTMQELVLIPGVGRKTANIVLSHGFGKLEGIAVDTHVKRVSFRLGFTKHANPEKIEKDLLQLVPKTDYWWMSTALINHGRETCLARKPHCKECFLNAICQSAFLSEKAPKKTF